MEIKELLGIFGPEVDNVMKDSECLRCHGKVAQGPGYLFTLMREKSNFLALQFCTQVCQFGWLIDHMAGIMEDSPELRKQLNEHIDLVKGLKSIADSMVRKRSNAS